MRAEVQQLGRLAGLVCVALLGLAAALFFNWHGLQHSLWYMLIASTLLCFGLYMAVYEIDRDEAKRHWRIVLIALTFGVLLKYLLIFVVAYLATRQWQYAVLGMAVAQIDPLQVASLKRKHMSKGAKTYLSMLASFDDPVTTIATPLILGIAGAFAGRELTQGGSWNDILLPLSVFALLLLIVAGTTLKHWLRGTETPPGKVKRYLERSEGAKNALLCVIAVISIPAHLFSLAAIAGWLIRPSWLAKGRRAEFMLMLALCGATFLLGILLAGGIDIRGGIILGLAAYSSQIVVAWVVRWIAMLVSRTEREAGTRFSRRDTWYLAFSQQNGITAIVLALNLEPLISGSVAVVSLAIAVINLANFGCNSLRGWVIGRHTKEAS